MFSILSYSDSSHLSSYSSSFLSSKLLLHLLRRDYSLKLFFPIVSSLWLGLPSLEWLRVTIWLQECQLPHPSSRQEREMQRERGTSLQLRPPYLKNSSRSPILWLPSDWPLWLPLGARESFLDRHFQSLNVKKVQRALSKWKMIHKIEWSVCYFDLDDDDTVHIYKKSSSYIFKFSVHYTLLNICYTSNKKKKLSPRLTQYGGSGHIAAGKIRIMFLKERESRHWASYLSYS